MFSIVICHLRWHSTKIIEEPYSFIFFSKRKKNCSFSFLISTFAAEFGEQIFEICSTQKCQKNLWEGIGWKSRTVPAAVSSYSFNINMLESFLSTSCHCFIFFWNGKADKKEQVRKPANNNFLYFSHSGKERFIKWFPFKISILQFFCNIFKIQFFHFFLKLKKWKNFMKKF